MFRNASIITAALMAASLTTAADAAAVITISDTAAGLLATLSGSLDTTGTTRATQAFFSGTDIGANPTRLTLGSGAVVSYGAVSGPTSLGTGGGKFSATTTSGTALLLYVQDTSVYLALASSYVSGAELSASNFRSGLTIAGAGLAAGSYVYTLPSDTLTVNIGAQASTAAVPEPATWATLVAGFALTGAAMRRRRPAMRAA